ncbi:MAG: elongation factor P [bacterium]|nr:elongation factor P [bacterium]
MKIIATQVRVGNVLQIDTDLYRVTGMTHVTPGKGMAHVQVKLKNLQTGNNKESRYGSSEKVEKVDVITSKMDYSYESGDEYVFMDNETFDQISIQEDLLAEAKLYLVPNTTVDVQTFEGRVIGIELPKVVVLEIVDTPPEVKGATATAQTKPATCETGLVVTVPGFVSSGTSIKVDTATGKYLERA